MCSESSKDVQTGYQFAWSSVRDAEHVIHSPRLLHGTRSRTKSPGRIGALARTDHCSRYLIGDGRGSVRSEVISSGNGFLPQIRPRAE